MPTHIVRLPYAGRDFYLEWSTVVDAPASPPMSLVEFTAYYRERYGAERAERPPLRMERVHATGASERGVDNVTDTVGFNRAGPDESCLLVEHIVPCALARLEVAARPPPC